MPKPKTDRVANVHVRMTAAEKQLIEKAAKADRRPIGTWATMALVKAAEEMLAKSSGLGS
jgi:uncharacterized protein (DUF1778 family)